MSEIEVGFKIIQTKEEAEKILLKNGFTNTFKTAHTRDIYFGKNIDFSNKTEAEIKRSLIRCRGVSLFENLQLLDKSFPSGKVNVDFKTAVSYFNKMFNEGYDVVFDTEKTDWIYEKDRICHQLQDIKDIGLLDYVYVNFQNKNLSEDEMFTILKQHMKDLGLSLECELGVDKLKSLYCKELKFSKSQYSIYDYQK